MPAGPPGPSSSAPCDDGGVGSRTPTARSATVGGPTTARAQPGSVERASAWAWLVREASTSRPRVPKAPTTDSSAATEAAAASSYEEAKSVAVESSPAMAPYPRNRPERLVAARAASSLAPTSDSAAEV